MATFCNGLSVCHLVRPFEQGSKTAFGLPESFQEFESGAVPESAWPDGGICKCARSQGKRCRNGKKRLQAGRNAQPLHDPSPSCTTWFLVGLSPRPMARKTIALTTELKETLHAGAKLAPLGPGKQRDGAWPLFAKVCQFVTSCVLLNKAARRRLAFPRVSKNLKVAPFQSPPGQMAAFVSLLEAKAKRCRNGKKRLQAGRNAQPLHDPLPACTTLFLAGIEPATYGS